MITKKIPFSPPDMTYAEVEEVKESILSGWITTGPRTKEFENMIAMCCGTNKVVCLNSATACMEMILRVLGVGPDDEVITSAYTYTATASVTCHVGAKVVMVDTAPDSFEIDYSKLADAITPRTKAILPVDLAGVVCDYDKIFAAVKSKKDIFVPANDIQKAFGRVVVLADAAHAFGAKWHGKMCGEIADFTSFSFHAVKNLTTAEGGALTWRPVEGMDDEWIYKQFQLLSLHGQKAFGRVVVLADAAHAFGAKWHGKMCGEIADFTSFSFHAVKNLTTAEGGALTWRPVEGMDDEWIYKQFQLLSLHGQNKDALTKTQLGAWEYDIVAPNYKCNMTDIMAAIGLAQLKRYPEMLYRRRQIIERYDAALEASEIQMAT